MPCGLVRGKGEVTISLATRLIFLPFNKKKKTVINGFAILCFAFSLFFPVMICKYYRKNVCMRNLWSFYDRKHSEKAAAHTSQKSLAPGGGVAAQQVKQLWRRWRPVWECWLKPRYSTLVSSLLLRHRGRSRRWPTWSPCPSHGTRVPSSWLLAPSCLRPDCYSCLGSDLQHRRSPCLVFLLLCLSNKSFKKNHR